MLSTGRFALLVLVTEFDLLLRCHFCNFRLCLNILKDADRVGGGGLVFGQNLSPRPIRSLHLCGGSREVHKLCDLQFASCS